MSIQAERAIARLRVLLGMTEAAAARAVAEVVDCFELEVDEFIRQRHGQLKQQGLANAEIYEQISGELQSERFLAPKYTARQIRRRIYG